MSLSEHEDNVPVIEDVVKRLSDYSGCPFPIVPDMTPTKEYTPRARIYLCGPISGASYQGATSWRESTKAYLQNCGFEAYSPMRGKEYLSTQQSIPALQQDAHKLAQNQAINARDSWDVRRCDILLANLEDAQRVSIGSLMEIADAWNQGKYIVLVMKPGDIHDHPFVRARASIVFEFLDEAVDYITEVLMV